MKANITNLKKVLKICAKAHNAEFQDWSNEGHISIGSESVPAVSDIQMILDAFYGNHDTVEADWGFTVVWLQEDMRGNKGEVNMDLCAMALPYGTKLS